MGKSKMIFVLPVFHNAEDVSGFIRLQLFGQTFKDYFIYVVVNGGEFTFSENERVKILQPGQNLGYLGSLRYVMENEKPDFEFITLCNTDLSFPNNNFLADYYKELKKDEFAIAGPRIFSSLTGSEQSPIYTGKLSKQKLTRLSRVFNNYPFYYIYQMMFYSKRLFKPKGADINWVSSPYALHGSFITLSSKYFERGGTLNYPVLLYGEELFLAEEALRIGLENFFIPSLKIRHNEHSTTGVYKNREQVNLMKQSIAFILEHYYNGK